MELTNLMQCIATTFGVKVGEAVRAEVDSVLQLEGLDVSTINAKITAIQNLLDADPNTPEFDIAQNFITTIAGLTARIAALEGDTRVAACQSAITALNSGLAAEVARAQAAEAALAAQITTINGNLASLSAQIAAIPTTPACDCEALAASIAANSTAIANLQGVDAQQAAQIAALQATVQNLQSSLTSNASAAAAAQATANAAAAAAAAAQAAANAAAAAVADLDDREHGHHQDHETKLGQKVTRAEVAAIDCVALGNLFAAGIQAGLRPNGY